MRETTSRTIETMSRTIEMTRRVIETTRRAIAMMRGCRIDEGRGKAEGVSSRLETTGHFLFSSDDRVTYIQ